MPKAYWIATYRSINDPEALAAAGRLERLAVGGPGGTLAVRADAQAVSPAVGALHVPYRGALEGSRAGNASKVGVDTLAAGHHPAEELGLLVGRRRLDG